MSSKKARLDQVLVDRGLVSTRSRAQAMILAQQVLVDDTPITKPGHQIQIDAPIRLRVPELKYVSRGALKLIHGLDFFGISAEGKIAIDVGSSTGGFTEVLLEQGAEKVYAIDVGTNQLAWKLRSDPRVDSRENTNARNLTRADFFPRPNLLVMDVSFISIRLLMPVLNSVVMPLSTLLVLFKPQFEVGKANVESGGIVRDQKLALATLDSVREELAPHGIVFSGLTESPIQGTDGNTEYLTCWISSQNAV